jgi:Flp pilus assembly protein TadB
MFRDRESWARTLSTCILAVTFAFPNHLVAETDHLVSPADLQKEAVSVSAARQQNLDKVRALLSGERAERAMQSMHVDGAQVRIAVATLSDQELAQLAVRADNEQRDFAAGHLSSLEDLLIIAAIVLVIVVVVVAH